MRNVLPLLLLGLAACYAPHSASGPPPGYTMGGYGRGYDGYGSGSVGYSGYGYGSEWGDRSLQASVWFDEFTGSTTIDLSRSAHVALFALQPGAGLQMIYPSYGRGLRQRFTGGRHAIYADRPSFRFASSRYGAGSAFQPTYIILIASERPLDVQPYLGLRQVPWFDRLSSLWNPYSITEVLASQIVPRPSSTDWTVAYHVLWPNEGYGGRADYRSGYRSGYRDHYRWVRCPGNVVLSVPVEALYYGLVVCPNGAVPPRDDDDPWGAGDGPKPLPEIRDGLPTRAGGLWMGPADGDGQAIRAAVRSIARDRGRDPEEAETALPSWRRSVAARPARPDTEPGDEGVAVRPSVPESDARPTPRWVEVPKRPSRPPTPTARPSTPTPRPTTPAPRPSPRPTPPPTRPSTPTRVERPPSSTTPARPVTPSRPAKPSKAKTPPRPTTPRPTAPRPTAPRVERPPTPTTRPAAPARPVPRPAKKKNGGGGNAGA